jgi:hypothetical protein
MKLKSKVNMNKRIWWWPIYEREASKKLLGQHQTSPSSVKGGEWEVGGETQHMYMYIQ